jgi:hypothetical protein
MCIHSRTVSFPSTPPSVATFLSRFFAQSIAPVSIVPSCWGPGSAMKLVGADGRTDGRTPTPTPTLTPSNVDSRTSLSSASFVDVPLCSWLDMSCCDVLFSSLSGVDSRTPTPTLEAKWAEAEAGGCYVVTLSLQYVHLYMSFASESLPLRVNP